MRTICLLACVLLSITVRAQTIGEIMQDAGDTLLRMLPTMYTSDPDRTLLLENLVRLNYLLGQAKPHLDQRQAGSEVSYQLIREQIDFALTLAGDRNTLLLRDAAADTFTLCASCHTQDRIEKRAFGISRIRALDEYLAGEFSYLTRDYDSALTSFANYAAGRERTPVRDNAVLERTLVITLGIETDPVRANVLLNKLSAFFEDNPAARERASRWLAAIERLREPGVQSPGGKQDARALLHYLETEWPAVQSVLSWQEEEVYWVNIHAELVRRLRQQSGSADEPGLLYWLAVSDRGLHYRFFGALSRGYLERCIRQFPDSPWAGRCLTEYETLALVIFSDPARPQLPGMVHETLSELRRLVVRGQR